MRQGQRTQMIQKARSWRTSESPCQRWVCSSEVCLDSPQGLGCCPVGHKDSSKDFSSGVTWSVLFEKPTQGPKRKGQPGAEHPSQGACVAATPAWRGGSWTRAEAGQVRSPEMGRPVGRGHRLQSLGCLGGRTPVRGLGDAVILRDGVRLASGGCDVWIGDTLHPCRVAQRMD